MRAPHCAGDQRVFARCLGETLRFPARCLGMLVWSGRQRCTRTRVIYQRHRAGKPTQCTVRAVGANGALLGRYRMLHSGPAAPPTKMLRTLSLTGPRWN
jgi:hypothetical protein